MSPIALDPAARFELVLLSDRDKPDPPSFVFRHLAARDFRAVAAVSDRMQDLPDDAIGRLCDEVEDALMVALVDWRGMVDPATGREIPFSREELDRVLTLTEMLELLTRLPEAMSLGPPEKKGSRSQSPSNTESSAPTATPDAAEGSSESGPAMPLNSSVRSARGAVSPPPNGPDVPTAGRTVTGS
jgi:hypothetical protein